MPLGHSVSPAPPGGSGGAAAGGPPAAGAAGAGPSSSQQPQQQPGGAGAAGPAAAGASGGAAANGGAPSAFANSPAVDGPNAVNLLIVYVAIAAHVFIMAYTDPVDSPAFLIQIILSSVQVFVLAALALAFFLLTSNTTIVRLGLYDRYARQYRGVYASMAAALLLLMAVRALSLYHVFSGLPVPFTWAPDSYYFPIWVFHRAALLLCYCLSAYAATRASLDPTYGVTTSGLFA